MFRDLWRDFISRQTSNLAEPERVSMEEFDIFKINDDDDDDDSFYLQFIFVETVVR